jgi:predicted RNase H-like HicB family nuclease
MSDGETPEAALKNVQEAIASWIEAAKEWKMEIPQPSPPMARVG